jgi:hypothetical protein
VTEGYGGHPYGGNDPYGGDSTGGVPEQDAGAEPAEVIGGAPPAVLPETGDPQVDAALAPLAGLPRQPVAEHVARFEQVHRQLQDALAEVDTGDADVDADVTMAGGA